MALFPFVPDVPGVPALARDVLSEIGLPPFLVSDLVSLVFGEYGARWGIFKDGEAVVLCDNVLALDFRKETDVSDYPVEDGGFESYNKVQRPYDARVRFSAGGTDDKLQSFLESIEKIVDTVELFDVVTPQRTYIGANVTSMSYTRSANRGVGLMVIEVKVVEIRVTAIAQFSNSKEPTGAHQVNGGTVQSSAVPDGSSLATSAEDAF